MPPRRRVKLAGGHRRKASGVLCADGHGLSFKDGSLEASVWFKHRAWIPIAWLLSLGNLGAVWFAAQPAEPWHATGHALLAVLFALGARHLMARQRADAQSEHSPDAIDREQAQRTIDGMQAHLAELEERVDFAERLLAKQRDADRLDAPPR